MNYVVDYKSNVSLEGVIALLAESPSTYVANSVIRLISRAIMSSEPMSWFTCCDEVSMQRYAPATIAHITDTHIGEVLGVIPS